MSVPHRLDGALLPEGLLPAPHVLPRRHLHRPLQPVAVSVSRGVHRQQVSAPPSNQSRRQATARHLDGILLLLCRVVRFILIGSVDYGHRRRQNAVSLHPTMGFCASNPCANGGRCVDNSHAGYFTCICAPPFLGTLTAEPTKEALQSPSVETTRRRPSRQHHNPMPLHCVAVVTVESMDGLSERTSPR